ncbi:MAG: aldehyde dehydrogenase family protein [Ignavibacteria bacterium]|jgi:acyl-CoA reductase-like NAD-dependent aldehyde dehydrogenase
MKADELQVFSPYTRELIDCVQMHNHQDAERMVDRAYALFHNRAMHLPLHERIVILERLIPIMEESVESLTIMAAKEGGKPYLDSKVEVLRAIQGVKSAIDTMHTMHGTEIPMGLTASSQHKLAFTIHEPIGVIFAISAFNHPLNLIVHQVVPAIAAGTPIIIKPASSTPRTCLTFIDMVYAAGLPTEWCQALICTSSLAQQLVSDTRIAFLSFIGSAEVGWKLRSLLAPGMRCALEHGGMSPSILAEDVTIEEFIDKIVKGAMYHSGQVCVSTQHLYVHQSCIDDVASALKEKVQRFKIGDPLQHESDGGPLIHPNEVMRVQSWIREAVEQGAKIVCGGNIVSETMHEPTVLLQPAINAKVSTSEIFGPVLCLHAYSMIDEAISTINASSFGFQASIFTKNTDIAFNVMTSLNASAVMHNDHTAFRVDWMPFGGRNQSGLGWGGIPYSIKEYSREKMMVFHSQYLRR